MNSASFIIETVILVLVPIAVALEQSKMLLSLPKASCKTAFKLQAR
jgi:hypothetical protein